MVIYHNDNNPANVDDSGGVAIIMISLLPEMTIIIITII